MSTDTTSLPDTGYDLFYGRNRAGGTEYLLTVWPDGLREISIRNGTGSWDAPVPLARMDVAAGPVS